MSDGAGRVYNQHLKYLNDNDDDRDPHTAFLEDLDKAVAKWLESGDQLVVGGDFNHEITEAPITTLFEKHGMSNMIFSLHDQTLFPSTSSKAYRNKRTVDGIFATPGLVPIRWGYLDITEFPGDHTPIGSTSASLML